MHLPRPLVCCLLLSVVFSSAALARDALAETFLHPPASARPQTWWHWMNGNISREGITADLEAMHRIGLGGAQIFNATQGEPAGPVKVFGPEWRSLMQHAITEADRLGLEITVHNCAGWSESGGPWVTPAQAMQRVVWSELRVHGPQALAVELPAPTLVVADYCADIATLAFPSVPGEARSVTELAPAVSSSTPGVEIRPLLSGNGGAVVELPLPAEDQPQVITLDFRHPVRFGSVRFTGQEYLAMPVNGRVEASDDGTAFRTLAEFPSLARGRNHPSMLVAFPETSARVFRLVITKVDARARALVLTSIDFGGARLAHTEERAAFRSDAKLAFLGDTIPLTDAIAASGVLDLSGSVKNGRLEWNVPAGDWTIVRFCHTPTGQMNAPAPDGGRGWECDKMSRAAVDAHFDALMGRIITDAGPLAGRSLKGVLADSWEAGSQNWTPAFRAEFERRRGYDLLPYLPVIQGRVVGSPEQSERFLWDYRRTIGELIAENHYAEFRALTERHGMTFYAEAPGINMPTVADELECKGRTDVPMGEFWMDGHNDSKETAAAAHVYGMRIAAAEAFTAKTEDAKWMKSPFDHKMLGDLQFTIGINQFVFHRFAHQPWLDRVPGMAMGRWGTNFDRTNTWWEQAKAWMQYLTRCQALLQSGLPVSDVCYFYGENVPNTLARNELSLPPGYSYDACNAETLLTRMTVRDGRVCFPDGVSYAVLVLADSDRMTPALLRKLKDLVGAGATVIGRRPERSPSLSGFPACDEEVRRLTAELWGNCDGSTVTEHRLGKGRVIWGRPVERVLADGGIGPDFLAASAGKFTTIHRKVGDAEVYFISSQNPLAVPAKLTFRVSGRIPELWHPDTGAIERVAEFVERDGRVTLPVAFDPAGSVFVVFRESNRSVDPLVSVTRDGAETRPGEAELAWQGGHVELTTAEAGSYVCTALSGKAARVTVPELPSRVDVAGPWTLRFPAGWGAPAQVSLDALQSWTESPDEGMKYFSGTATYSREIELAPALFGANRSLWLDLGVVKELAQVVVNGQDLGVLWKPPFRINISGVAHPGRNTLEIKVTNLWPNRMIGDLRLPPEKRRTWSTFNPFKADSPLLVSGLLGPVRITPAVTVAVP